jgi:hypothetical protein
VKRDEDSRHVELEAIEEVQRVDAGGAPVALEYAVESLTVETPAGQSEVLPRGRVVTAERGRGTVTFHASGPLPADAEKALGQLISPLSFETSDDDVFGTTEPRAIGAIWPVNAALAAKDLADEHFQVPVEGVSGRTQLVGLAEAAGRTCLQLAGELSVSASRHTGEPGAPTETLELRRAFRRLLPVDGVAPELDSTVAVDLDVTVVRTLGPNREARTTTTSHEEKRRRFTPLP